MQLDSLFNLAPLLFLAASAIGGIFRVVRARGPSARRTNVFLLLPFLCFFGYLALFPWLSGKPNWFHIFGSLRSPWIWPFWLGYFLLLAALFTWTWWFDGDLRLIESGWLGHKRIPTRASVRVFTLAVFVIFPLVFAACHALGVYESMLGEFGQSANKPAPGNAGWVSGFQIDHHRPGVPEPGRSA